MRIGGESGVADGFAVLEAVVYCMIYPSFLSKISWTGRAGKGQPKKVALSKYANIVKLILEICQKADNSYGHDDCLEDLKYKIIKYAHSKYVNSDTATSVAQENEACIST